MEFYVNLCFTFRNEKFWEYLVASVRLNIEQNSLLPQCQVLQSYHFE
eukprot:UN03707